MSRCRFEVDTSHLPESHPKRKLVFQPSMFRCYINFREGRFLSWWVFSASCKPLEGSQKPLLSTGLVLEFQPSRELVEPHQLVLYCHELRVDLAARSTPQYFRPILIAIANAGTEFSSVLRLFPANLYPQAWSEPGSKCNLYVCDVKKGISGPRDFTKQCQGWKMENR